MKVFNCFFCTILLLVAAGNNIFSIEGEIPIWPGAAPGSEALSVKDSIVNRELSGSCTIDRAILNIVSPSLIPFIPENPNGTAVIICPGGAYQRIVYDVEGVDIAEMFNELGVTAFVLKYRLPYNNHDNKQYVPLQDVQRAMRYVKNFASTWSIDTSKIGIMGCSAGGHAAASLATDFDKLVYSPIDSIDALSARPYFLIELYPVISMEPKITHIGTRDALIGSSPAQQTIDEFSAEKHVSLLTPPAFFARAIDDGSVNAQNSIQFVNAMKTLGLSVHFNTYKGGGHGKGICKATGTDFARWVNDCKVWMDSLGLVIYTASDDASLKEININNVLLANFNPDTLNYSIELPYGTTKFPTVSATINFLNATSVITKSTTFPGTVTIEVTAHNGINKRTYNLNFTVSPESAVSDTKDESFKIYPNPARNQLNIEFGQNPYGYKITIFSLDGCQLKAQLCPQDAISSTLDIHELPAGLYLVEISNPGMKENMMISKF